MAGNKNLTIMDQLSHEQGSTAPARGCPAQDFWAIQGGLWPHRGLWHTTGHSEGPVQDGRASAPWKYMKSPETG